MAKYIDLDNLQTFKQNTDAKYQDKLPTIINNRYLHTNASTGNLEWSELSIPNVVQDLTTNTAETLDSTAWGVLKSTHTATIASPTMTGLDSSYEFVENWQDATLLNNDNVVQTSNDGSGYLNDIYWEFPIERGVVFINTNNNA